jgi:hypothetical protein
MDRRSFLGSVAAVAALPMAGMAALPVAGMASSAFTERIRIKKFTESMVTLEFPSERARSAFWIAFTDVLWPRRIRVGKNAESFEESWGEILRGEGRFGGFTAPISRHGFFDDYALKAAVVLKDQGILLEVIKTEKGPNYKHETVVLPKFHIHTETRATA